MACSCCTSGRCCYGLRTSECGNFASAECAAYAGDWSVFANCDQRACVDPLGNIACQVTNPCACQNAVSYPRDFVESVATCDCVALTAAGRARGGCRTGYKCCGPTLQCQATGGTFSVPFTFDVQNNAWFDTGVTLTAGQSITITATATNDRGPAGTVEWNGIGTTATPAGVTSAACNCCDGASVTSAFCHMALIGSVGSTAGPYFLVGTSYTGTPGAGKLYLRQNDTITGDNRGSFSGTITGPIDPCPGYTAASVGEPIILPPPSTRGPGASLKGILGLFGIVASPTCSCTARAAEMDSWGEWGCLTRLPLIVGWLGEEAAKRDLWFCRPAGYALVLVAVALSALSRPWRGNSQ